MAHGYDGSRSPVRALGTGTTPTRAGTLPGARTWSEPRAQAIIPPAPSAAPSLEDIALACPECGYKVRLALIPTSPEGAPEAHSRDPTSALRSAPAPEPEPLLSFEDSIQRHKRELMTWALEESDGVMTRAAKTLGLKYTTFVAMAHRLDVRQWSEPLCLPPAVIRRQARLEQRRHALPFQIFRGGVFLQCRPHGFTSRKARADV